MTTLVVQLVGGAVLGLLLFMLGLALGNYHANPLVDEFDVPPDLPPDHPGCTACPDCGCGACWHGPNGCRNCRLTCPNTAEDVHHLVSQET